ncbi:MAG: glycine--tRNA ligase subunit beta [Woeseia sp.]
MAKVDAADFLVEIGTEELPPKSLRDLSIAFAANLASELDRQHLVHGDVSAFASPRRLAVLVRAMARAQAHRETELRGPPVSVAFDKNGEPTAAARAFASKCGVSLEKVGRTKTARGEWLSYRLQEVGQSAGELLPAIVQQALDKLPVQRRMRWSDHDFEFVRPVHWVLMLHGDAHLTAQVAGVVSGGITYGHRFLAPAAIHVPEPGKYGELLESEGFVLADFALRRQRIEESVRQAAADEGGTAVGDDALYDEVTALTEWPVALTGTFDDGYLDLPQEVIIATLTGHQRYFPIADAAGKLLNRFVVVANLVSRDPDQVRDGNERVIRPRLADAAFFWKQDQRASLDERQSALKDVVYQQGLGSVDDRSQRVASVAMRLAEQLDCASPAIERAARLAKCDLLTGMVGEFPELQGTMGRYYAEAAGEAPEVATAIGEQYLPRFAGDGLPASRLGQLLSIADRLDNLAGAFALDRKPSGNRDPFGLRRAALGIVRIAIENELDLDLPALIGAALELQPVSTADLSALADELYDFVVERMRSWSIERLHLTAEIFDSVRGRRPPSLLDFDQRLQAVAAFVKLEPAATLAAANKRIANILRQADYEGGAAVDLALLTEPAENALHTALQAADQDIRPLLRRRDYTETLARLAGLREPVDQFFDSVMVMTDDDDLRRNRLALLAEMRGLFLEVADISRLSIG